MDFRQCIRDIAVQQLDWTTAWHSTEPSSFIHGFSGIVQEQHYCNFQLWHLEDIARDPRATDTEIAQVKRAIDKLNQQRNDLIEQLDMAAVQSLQQEKVFLKSSAPLNSEGPGSIIDRASIFALKIYHMQLEMNRQTAPAEHRKKAENRVNLLKEQRADLLLCLEELIAEVYAETRRFRLNQAFKMYNDPTLNPRIYQTKSEGTVE